MRSASTISRRQTTTASPSTRSKRWDDQLAWTYKKAEAEALHSHGVFKADNAALEQSIAAAKEALRIAERILRARRLGDHAECARQCRAGAGRATGRDRQSRRLRRGLPGRAGGDPARPGSGRWAKTRNNLANALTTLGTRNGDAARLAEAVAAFADVIDQFEKDGDKSSWAAAQSNGGKALLALGEIENSYRHG